MIALANGSREVAETFAAILWVALWCSPLIICAFIARSLARPSGRTTLGFWLGLLLGPMGILIAAVIGLQRRPLTPRRPVPKTPPAARRPVIVPRK